MRSNTNKCSSVNSRPLFTIFERDETDISDDILSEGTKIHEPMSVDHLEQNMSHIKLGKDHCDKRDCKLICDFDDQFEMNLLKGVQRDRKSQSSYNKTPCATFLPFKVNKEESKYIYAAENRNPASHPTMTLKSEISLMLKILASNRKLKCGTCKAEIPNNSKNFSQYAENIIDNKDESNPPARVCHENMKKNINIPLNITVDDIEPCIKN